MVIIKGIFGKKLMEMSNISWLDTWISDSSADKSSLIAKGDIKYEDRPQVPGEPPTPQPLPKKLGDSEITRYMTSDSIERFEGKLEKRVNSEGNEYIGIVKDSTAFINKTMGDGYNANIQHNLFKLKLTIEHVREVMERYIDETDSPKGVDSLNLLDSLLDNVTYNIDNTCKEVVGDGLINKEIKIFVTRYTYKNQGKIKEHFIQYGVIQDKQLGNVKIILKPKSE